MSKDSSELQNSVTKVANENEEKYFFKVNQELIKNLKNSEENLETATKEQDLVCNKCGGQMRVVELLGVNIDECTSCKGVYLDKASIENLMQKKDEEKTQSLLEWLNELGEIMTKADPKWTP